MTTRTTRPPALTQNLELIDQGIALLRDLPTGLYASSGDGPGFQQTPGPHLRHSIDAYDCLLAGLETGLVDYDARSRAREVETSREQAAAALERTRAQLEAVDAPADRPLRVLVDVDGDAEDAAAESTLGREYQFLVGHTVHHYALIALILRHTGYDPGREFGVAPSTLRHWRQSGS